MDSIFEYTSFDKVNKITAKGWVSEVYYDNGRSRYMRKDTNSTSFAKTVTHYLGNVEYKYSGSDVKIKRHIGGLIIESTSHQNNRSTWTFNHLLKDHLGSTHTVVNKQGQSIQRFSFNAWGERRQPAAVISNGAIFNVIPIGSVWNNLSQDIEETTNRGFTGHEHFDQVGIIHMNGRIYDPTIGRFLQADPIIQDPYNTQSLNRYSYVMNNPLSFTDPSGYSRMRKGWWRMPVAIAITVFTAGAASGVMAMVNCVANSGAIIGQAFAISIAGGAAAGAVATGTLKGAVKGGLIAAVTFGIGHGATNATGAGVSPLSAGGKVVAHSIVSGVSAELDGGKFGHGFASALMSMGADKIGLSQAKTFGGRIVSNAIVAGSISELTGGKFANGAMSAAFRVAYNEVLEGQKTDHKITAVSHLDGRDDPVGHAFVILEDNNGNRVAKGFWPGESDGKPFSSILWGNTFDGEVKNEGVQTSYLDRYDHWLKTGKDPVVGEFAYKSWNITKNQYSSALNAMQAWNKRYSLDNMCGTFAKEIVGAAGYNIGSTMFGPKPVMLFEEFGGRFP